MTNAPSQFIWYELLTTEPDAAAAFYHQVVGWDAANSGIPGMDYRILTMAGERVAGLTQVPPAAAAQGMRPAWLSYVTVPDVDASLASIVAAGGSVRMPAMEVPGVGRMAGVADPQGAGLYVMTPAGTGPSVSFASGKPGHGGWNELHTTDWQAALAFYEAQFGWAKSEALDMGPMGTYLLFNTGGDEPVGGMMTNPHMPHPAWLYYFNVDNIVAALSRVTAAGGTILREPTEVPGGLWILHGLDPQGAMFALVGPHRG